MRNTDSRELLPRTHAYAEIWLDGEKVVTPEAEEPLYGDVYLPRKFKIGLAAPDDNSIDVLSHDIAIIVLPAFMSLLLAKLVGIVVGAVINFFAARWSIEARLM